MGAPPCVNVASRARRIAPRPGHQPVGVVPIPARSPPRSRGMAAPPTAPVKPTAPAKSKIVTPAVPRCPTGTPPTSPSARPAVPDATNPRRVIVPGAIDHHPVLHFRSPVAGRIPLIHVLRGSTVDLHVGHIMQRRTWRDRVDYGGYRCGDRPWSIQRGGGIPDSIPAGVPQMLVHLDNRRAGVHYVVKRRAGDGLQPWRAVELRLPHQSGSRHSRALRDAVGDEGFACLPCPRHTRFHILLRAAVGDLGKIRWQAIRRDELPGPVKGSGPAPTARDQHVALLIAEELEDVTGRIGRVKEVGAGDRHKVGLAVEQDQFGRRRGNKNVRCGCLSERRRVAIERAALPRQ